MTSSPQTKRDIFLQRRSLHGAEELKQAKTKWVDGVSQFDKWRQVITIKAKTDMNRYRQNETAPVNPSYYWETGWQFCCETATQGSLYIHQDWWSNRPPTVGPSAATTQFVHQYLTVVVHLSVARLWYTASLCFPEISAFHSLWARWQITIDILPQTAVIVLLQTQKSEVDPSRRENFEGWGFEKFFPPPISWKHDSEFPPNIQCLESQGPSLAYGPEVGGGSIFFKCTR